MKIGIVGSRRYENKKRIKDFIFKIKQEKVWFSIGEGKADRYTFDGDILQGISQYLKIINHIKKRDGE